MNVHNELEDLGLWEEPNTSHLWKTFEETAMTGVSLDAVEELVIITVEVAK